VRSPFRLNPSVTARVWRLFAVMACALFVLMGALAWSLDRVRETAVTVAAAEETERGLLDLEKQLIKAESGQRGYLLTEDKSYLQPFLEAERLIPGRVSDLRSRMQDSGGLVEMDQIAALVVDKMAELRETVDLVDNGQSAQAQAVVKTDRGKLYMDRFRDLSAKITITQAERVRALRGNLLRDLHRVVLTASLGGGVAIILLFVYALGTARRLGRPIAALMKGIEVIAEGRFDTGVPVTSADEIGRVTAAFNQMAEQILGSRNARDVALMELKRSNADLDGLAYAASHDLKAPLRGIRNLANWIEADVEATATPEIRENLRLLKVRVERLAGLLDGLLAYARAGSKIEIAEQFDTKQLVAEIGEYLSPPAGFVIETPRAMPTLFSPKPPLEQVLRNLIGNAIKHHDGPGGRVEITARDVGDAVEFRVQDDGPGIPLEFHERIFQMFQTLKSRDEVEGSGLGLAIVKKIVEGLGGSIHVESLSEPRRTVFAFTWPKEIPQQSGSSLSAVRAAFP